jgi:hypothetical protein
MILRLIFFSISWAAYTLTFFGLASTLSGFHSAYIQSTFTIALEIGFMNALVILLARLIFPKISLVVFPLLILLLDFFLIQSTTEQQIGYYITGHKSTAIATVVLAAVALAVEFIKERVIIDVVARV